MEVDQLHGQRFEMAFEGFIKGEALTFRQVTFRLERNGYLGLYVLSNWQPEYITRQGALEELELAKETVAYVTKESPPLASVVAELPRRFILYAEHGWHETTDLCQLIDGELTWSETFPR